MTYESGVDLNSLYVVRLIVSLYSFISSTMNVLWARAFLMYRSNRLLKRSLIGGILLISCSVVVLVSGLSLCISLIAWFWMVCRKFKFEIDISVIVKKLKSKIEPTSDLYNNYILFSK